MKVTKVTRINAIPSIYEFADFRLDTVARVLRRGEKAVALTGREFDTLVALVQRAGEPMSRAELLAAIWGETYVSDDNLRKQISTLRQKLGKDATGNDYIVTVPNRGYQLAVGVMRRSANGSELLPAESVDPSLTEVQPIRRPRLVIAAVALGIALLLTGVVAGVFRVRTPAGGPRVGRLLAVETSDTRHPKVLQLGQNPDYLEISRDGKWVFALAERSRRLSVIHTDDDKVSGIDLPQEGGAFTLSPDGLIYIASMVDGFLEIRPSLKTGVAESKRVQTGGRVWNMAMTPNGRKLYLAMGMSGVKRYSPESGELVTISDRVCPEHLALDPAGTRLYVAYQCGGPQGRSGHDSVEVFDTATETSLGIIHGLPLVGQNPAVSPDGTLLALDGYDACLNPEYDHEGCPAGATRVLHLVRAADRQLLRTVTYDRKIEGPARFLDSSRFLMFGPTLTVFDAARFAKLEEFAFGAFVRNAVFTPDGKRAYVGILNGSVAVLNLESASCQPPSLGLEMLFTGDGVFDNGTDTDRLAVHGHPSFVSGRLGQAFSFDGSTSLSLTSLGHKSGLPRDDFTIALYARPGQHHEDEVLLDWRDYHPDRSIRLSRSVDGRFVFHFRPDGAELQSSGDAQPGTWYHIMVTKAGSEARLYVDGVLNSEAPVGNTPQLGGPFSLGSDTSGAHGFTGELDELTFYRRAMGPEEVRAFFVSRESSPCRM